ncbi:hypothetical protein R2Q26_05765 [Nitrosomonas sp. Is37]|nr:hypothetical protein [Nitrosomonas sp. Is37]
MWAVNETSSKDMKGRITKSKRMKVGAAGLLYCNEIHSFTTPFLVYLEPDPDSEVTDIWPEKWRLPFKIHPLGTPARRVHSNEAKSQWPLLKDIGPGGVSAAMNITGTTVFVPIEVSTDDWSLILSSLATPNPSIMSDLMQANY